MKKVHHQKKSKKAPAKKAAQRGRPARGKKPVESENNNADDSQSGEESG